MKKKIFTMGAFLGVYAPSVIAILMQNKREFNVTYNDRFVEFKVFGCVTNIEAFEHMNHCLAYSKIA